MMRKLPCFEFSCRLLSTKPLVSTRGVVTVPGAMVKIDIRTMAVTGEDGVARDEPVMLELQVKHARAPAFSHTPYCRQPSPLATLLKLRHDGAPSSQPYARVRCHATRVGARALTTLRMVVWPEAAISNRECTVWQCRDGLQELPALLPTTQHSLCTVQVCCSRHHGKS